MSDTKPMTVSQLVRKLTEMKKLGLGNAEVVMEGCDCDGKVGTVEATKRRELGSDSTKLHDAVYLGKAPEAPFSWS